MNKRVTESSSGQAAGKGLYEWVQSLLSAVLIVVLTFTFFVRQIGVDGSSMFPTLHHGDRVLVLNDLWCGEYEAGDIVVLCKDSFIDSPIIKRVIATGGQTVDIDFDLGRVYVDGECLDEPYIYELTTKNEGQSFPLTLEEGEVFVMGDNRLHSSDSRNPDLGAVDERYLIGKAILLIYPAEGDERFYEERDWSRIGSLNGR